MPIYLGIGGGKYLKIPEWLIAILVCLLAVIWFV